MRRIVNDLIGLIWREINTPSGQVGPLSAAWGRMLSAGGHALLGAAAAAPFGVWGLGGALVAAVAYWLAKERGDLRRGGELWDGAEDALMVGLGFWYGVWWWPALILGAMGYILASAAARAK